LNHSQKGGGEEEDFTHGDRYSCHLRRVIEKKECLLKTIKRGGRGRIISGLENSHEINEGKKKASFPWKGGGGRGPQRFRVSLFIKDGFFSIKRRERHPQNSGAAGEPSLG